MNRFRRIVNIVEWSNYSGVAYIGIVYLIHNLVHHLCLVRWCLQSIDFLSINRLIVNVFFLTQLMMREMTKQILQTIQNRYVNVDPKKSKQDKKKKILAWEICSCWSMTSSKNSLTNKKTQNKTSFYFSNALRNQE